MTTDLLPEFIRSHYETYEVRHACAILKGDFSSEWADIVDVLTRFRLRRSEILTPGGAKSPISEWMDLEFTRLGWAERSFKTRTAVDDVELEAHTHKIDCYKNSIGLEIEWNSKDQTFDRDLENFRLLAQIGKIGVGVIVTRADELQMLFGELGKGKSYGASTTHMSKLISRIESGRGGGCPLLVFGIRRALYLAD